MALKFLPIQTPSTVGILVLTRDKYLQSEIELALHDYQHIFFASNANEASSILADGQIGIVIIDANILESDDQDLISEMLSFFPELVLVSFVEIGSTHNLVALSEKYDIYRYLKIPCAHKQIANCVRSAVKKYLKQYSNKDIEDTESKSLPFFLLNKHIATTAVAIATIVLMILLTIINPGTENNKQLANDNIDNSTLDDSIPTIPIEAISVLEQEKQLVDNIELDTTDETLSTATILPDQNHVEISATESYISPALEQSSQLNEFLEKAQLRLNNDNLSKPIDGSAKFYLLSLKEMAPENDKVNILLIELADKLLGRANTAINENNISKAKYFIQEAKTLDARTEIISRLEDKIVAQNNIMENTEKDAEQDTTPVPTSAPTIPDPKPVTIQERIEKQEKINALLTSARKSYISEQYFSPENNNASHFLLLAKEIDRKNEDIIYSLNELADKTLSIIQVKLTDEQVAEASILINHVKQLGVRTEEIEKLEQEVN